MEDPTEDAEPRPFADWLREQRNGVSHSELTDALAELIEAVAETGKAGSLTYKIKVAPAGKGSHTVTVGDSVDTNLPQHDRDTSLFFIDRGGRALTRRDPYQSELPLVEVPRPSQLKEA